MLQVIYVMLVLSLTFPCLAEARHYPAPPKGHCVVLCYHRLDTIAPTQGAVMHLEDFRRQMKWLTDNGYRTLSLDGFDRCLKEGVFPAKAVLITFDDSCASTYTLAYPILKEYGLQATVFPIVSYMPDINPDGKDPNRYHSFLTASQLVSMLDIASVGSHTDKLHYYKSGKPIIATFPENGVHTDLTVSRNILQQLTGRRVYALAWPFGYYTPRTVALAKQAGYSLLFTIKPGVVTGSTDPLAIPRIPIREGSLEEFKAILEKAQAEPYS